MSDWSDVEYLLKRSYLQGRTASAPLINRENALNFSAVGMLSKTTPDAINSQRKLLQLSADIYKTTEKENEKIIVSDFIDSYAEELTLMLAKKLNLPSVSGSKIGPKSSNKQLIQSFLSAYENNINQKIDMESVQRTVDEADSILAAIHHEIRNPVDSDDVAGLTQSIYSSVVIGDEDCVMIDGNEDKKISPTTSNASNQQSNNPFMTAKQALAKNQPNSFNNRSTTSNYINSNNFNNNSYNPAMQARKLLGAKRRIVDNSNQGTNHQSGYRDEGRDINTEFSYYNMAKTPAPQTNNNNNNGNKSIANASSSSSKASNINNEEPIDERLAGIEPRLIEMIRNEIMHRVDNITWDSIAGLEHAKNSIKEIVVWPMLRPDIFKGLRGPPKGLLLFGPPGTGKTMIGKCIASQAKATFFSISASSLTSKWVGEGEKMVRALFAVARCSQPAVIFIDEIDSLLTQRTDGEVEASRRIKTEFLVQFDGAGTNSEDRILVIGATNRPQEIDEAARRRLLKRLYIPLPEFEARATIIRNLLSTQPNSLTDSDIEWICSRTDGYSGSDMDGLCREAAIGPIRSISDILNISSSDVRPINRQDFEEALTQVRASVSNQDLELYLDWNQKFGSLNVKSGTL